jgi:glycosyltransferase involved in cell wall biosynthesis
LSAARDRAAGRKTLLVVDHYVPRPDRDAGSRSVDHIMQCFERRGWLVKFWPHNLWFEPGYVERLQMRGVEVVYGIEMANKFDEWIRDAGHRIDAVLLNRPVAALEYIDVVRRHTKARILYYGHDIHHLRMALQREIEGGRGPARSEIASMESLEKRLWAQADAVLYPSASEVEEVRSAVPGATAVQVPLYAYDDFPVPEGLATRDRDLVVFVAGFSHPPNVDAALWLVRDVWPRVLSNHPGARLALVGSHPTPEVYALRSARIEVTGSVSDAELDEFYRTARVAVIPLRFGAGVKGKTVEALRSGLPAVTTSVGAQGLAGVEAVLAITDEPQAFADAVSELLASDEVWERRSRGGLGYAQAHFSTEALVAAMERALGYPLGRGQGAGTSSQARLGPS